MANKLRDGCSECGNRPLEGVSIAAIRKVDWMKDSNEKRNKRMFNYTLSARLCAAISEAGKLIIDKVVVTI